MERKKEKKPPFKSSGPLSMKKKNTGRPQAKERKKSVLGGKKIEKDRKLTNV